MTRVLAVLVALGAVAHAAPARVAVVPIRDSAPSAGDAAPIEKAVVEALKQTPALELANLGATGQLQAPKNLPVEARADARPAARAPALGKEFNAPRVLAVETARLGVGRVVYLQAIEASSGKQLASTTATLSGESGEIAAADKIQLRGALVRLFEPERFIGRLQAKVDVPNAELQIDGKKTGAATGTHELAVGTHAVRVTHPAYRDFLRFVEIEFDKTATLDVALSAYPLAEGEMTEKMRKQAAAPRKLPWWRSWWALTLSGVVLTGVTAGIIVLAYPGIKADQTVSYKVQPTP
jgi:hypothetical protein